MLEFLNEIFRTFLRNKEWIFSGIGAFLIGLFFTWLTSRKKPKLRIKLTLTISFVQVEDQLGPNIPLLTAFITNISTRNVFVQQPLIKTSKIVDGTTTFQLIRRDQSTKFPMELTPGEQFRQDYQSVAFEKLVLSKLKDRHSVRLLVTNTLGHKFYSNKFLVKTIKQHNQLAGYR